MAYTKVAFPQMPWAPGNHPLERKKLCPERPLAMLEFAPGFADPNWCARSHVILVLSGALELELDAVSGTAPALRGGASIVERLAAGECCAIDAGTRHRARNPGDVAVVAFIASEIEVAR